MTPSPVILPAREEDVPAIMALLQQRIDWMDEKGLYQWNKTGYLTCYPPAHFQRMIREEQTFVAWTDGLGKEMLAYAEDFARERGKPFLRLDSQKVNDTLSRYYEALGYLPAGECVDGAYVGILREKSLFPST